MKKLLLLILTVVLLSGVCILPVSAQEEDKYAPEVYSAEEKQAGFSFKYIYLVIKNEYSFEEFTPEKLGSPLIERVEAPYEFNPDNENYDKSTWELFLKVYLKEKTRENVIELYKQMEECEYVKSAGIAEIYYSIPFFPESAEEIGYYKGEYRPWVSPDNETYIANGSNMIRNPYYKKYYNDLLAHSTALYRQFADYIGDVDYLSYYAENHMEKDINYVTLIFDHSIALSEYVGAIRDYNMSVLEKHFDEDEILYIGDYSLAAVVAISKENKDVIKEIEELAFIGDAFFTRRGMSLAVIGTFTLGNVVGAEEQVYYDDPALNVPLKKVSAADARKVLRYSAGLEKIEKEPKRFFYCADMNFDGEITSADARLILRTAAGLEKEYEITFGYSSGWADFMGSELGW